ncbi:MAG TPA: DUF1194 domain-containing protein, partial [Alphaproteobacteria bacterium]|nr:DUF1194 domain-containing protein [Alphaproteobacteria bacterium]
MLRALAFLTALLAGLAGAGSVRAAPAVDLALVLAVDVSASVDVERYDLQMRGYAEAFRTPELINAIRNVPTGAIAVTLVQWGSYGDQHQVIGWTTVRDMQTA